MLTPDGGQAAKVELFPQTTNSVLAYNEPEAAMVDKSNEPFVSSSCQPPDINEESKQAKPTGFAGEIGPVVSFKERGDVSTLSKSSYNQQMTKANNLQRKEAGQGDKEEAMVEEEKQHPITGGV